MRCLLLTVVLASTGCTDERPPTAARVSPTTDAAVAATVRSERTAPVAEPAFALPDEAARRRAIGDLRGLGAQAQAAFAPSDDFAPLPTPGPGDWLSLNAEPGQTFADYRAWGGNRVKASRDVLYIQPIGTLRSGAPSWTTMQRFIEAYFTLETRVLPARPVAEVNVGMRSHRGGRQLLTGTVLAGLRAQVPRDAYAVIGVTSEDLYPEDDWNFVFGQASFRERIGIHSVARYFPSFYGESDRGARERIHRRTYIVLAHEIGHMFGLEHCTHYHCVMNGSNGLRETDRSPLHLCPVCLRKLDLALGGTDHRRRYAGLASFLAGHGLAADAAWYRERARRIPPPAP